MEGHDQLGRDRFADIRDRPLDPLSLVGSWFLCGDRMTQDVEVGLVVGEPQPGVYLCQVVNRITDQPMHQVLMTAKEMADREDFLWRFFDTKETMVGAVRLLEESAA